MTQGTDDRHANSSLRVVAQQWISVDGFAASPPGEQAIFEAVSDNADRARQRWNETLLDTVDEVLHGRVSYQSFVRFWPDADVPIATSVNGIPKVVFSRTLTSAPWATVHRRGSSAMRSLTSGSAVSPATAPCWCGVRSTSPLHG